jgi:hypothetical protein
MSFLYLQLDTNLSQRYHLKCWEILEKSIGVAPVYHTRSWDAIAIRPDIRSFNSTYHLLRLPTLTWKTRVTVQIFNGLSGQTTKPSNLKQSHSQLRTGWPHGCHGITSTQMCVLFRVIVAQAWVCPITTPQHWSCSPCAKIGVAENQHNLQNSSSVDTSTYSRPDYLLLLTLFRAAGGVYDFRNFEQV